MCVLSRGDVVKTQLAAKLVPSPGKHAQHDPVYCGLGLLRPPSSQARPELRHIIWHEAIIGAPPATRAMAAAAHRQPAPPPPVTLQRPASPGAARDVRNLRAPHDASLRLRAHAGGLLRRGCQGGNEDPRPRLLQPQPERHHRNPQLWRQGPHVLPLQRPLA